MAKPTNGQERRKDGVWDPLKDSRTDRRRAAEVP
ncbi:MAG: lysine decarboxylase, partial [Rhizobium sp.]|nr:lysine decarboxylase [Rhizobium sp.]